MTPNGPSHLHAVQPREAQTTRPPIGAASISSQRRLDAMEKQRMAVALKRHGATYEQIAQQLGYRDRGTARRALLAAVERWGAKDVQEYVDIEVDKLDYYLRVLAPKIEKGDVKAIGMALKASERRSKLLGLDRPVKVEMSGQVEMVQREVIEIDMAIDHILAQRVESERVFEPGLAQLGPGGEGEAPLETEGPA
jgi:hypothetical protein